MRLMLNSCRQNTRYKWNLAQVLFFLQGPHLPFVRIMCVEGSSGLHFFSHPYLQKKFGRPDLAHKNLNSLTNEYRL